jgi:hypothetical protein
MNERTPGTGQGQRGAPDNDNWSDRGAESVFGARASGADPVAWSWPPATAERGASPPPTDWGPNPWAAPTRPVATDPHGWASGPDTATPLQRTALWPDAVVPESGRTGPYGFGAARDGGAYAPDRARGGGAYGPDRDAFGSVDDWRQSAEGAGVRRAPWSAGGDDAPGRRGDAGTGRAGRTGPRFPIGLGALVAGAGAAAVVAALLSLPWFTAAGQDLTLADMRAEFTVPATDPADVVADAGKETGSTLPDGLPTPGEVTDAAEQQVRDTTGTMAAAAIDGGKRRYLELYTERLWLGVAGVAVAAAVLGTLLAPRSRALSLVLGVRRLAGVATVLAGVAHGAAVWVVFYSGDGAPAPAYGVWLGVGGLAAVLLGCIIGPRRASA